MVSVRRGDRSRRFGPGAPRLISGETPAPAIETGRSAHVELLGSRIDRVTMDEAVDRCRSFLGGDRRPRLIVPVNAAIFALADRSERLRRVIREADLVLADGAAVVWASRLLGGGLRHRVTGIDLMCRLAEVADRQRLRVFLLGARPEVVRKVADKFRAEYPGVVIAGSRDGFFAPEDQAAIITQVRESRPDILLVALPTPFKETWCLDHLGDFGVPVVLPVGGSFDVFSGLIRRAPRWMQAAGLEWSWRLLMEPRQKWRRYVFLNTTFVWLCLLSALRGGRATRSVED